jgi:hypothetical protein
MDAMFLGFFEAMHSSAVASGALPGTTQSVEVRSMLQGLAEIE